MSTVRGEIYQCMHCGMLVEALRDAGGTLVCCGEPMVAMKENTTDASKEKHVPVLMKNSDGSSHVVVGSAPHPMEPEHFIEWIELINGSYVNRKYLKPGDPPVADFHVHPNDKMEVRAFCNKHGLWKK